MAQSLLLKIFEILQIFTKLVSHITTIWNVLYNSHTFDDVLSSTISCCKMKSKKQLRSICCLRWSQSIARQYNNHNNVTRRDQNKNTFKALIMCCSSTIKNLWFWISSHFFGHLGTMQSSCARSSRIAKIRVFVSNLLYYVIRLLISSTWMFNIGW